jgi:hypothetical protein
MGLVDVTLAGVAKQEMNAEKVNNAFLGKRADNNFSVEVEGAVQMENTSAAIDRDLSLPASNLDASSCSDINWGDGSSCQDHIEYLVNTEHYKRVDAYFEVGQESNACRHCVPKQYHPGEGDAWELIGDFNIAEELEGKYMKNKQDVPQCMQGIVWMDQQCTTWHQLPLGYHCVTINGFASVDEYTTGFKWWDGDSRCVAFGRDSWTFGKASIYKYVCHYDDVVFCQTNQDTHDDPCAEGAHFELPGSDYALQKTSFGWDRISYKIYHYPLLQVIDWQGQKTRWFDDYWKVVSRLHCPLTQLNCNLNQWASTNQIARCLRAIA